MQNDDFYGAPPGDDFYEDISHGGNAPQTMIPVSQAGANYGREPAAPAWFTEPSSNINFNASQDNERLLGNNNNNNNNNPNNFNNYDNIPSHNDQFSSAEQQQQLPPQQLPPAEEGGGPSARPFHPIATFFHIFFRLSALVVYIILSFTNVSFVTTSIIVVTLLAMDFWTVKNITGRLLVGMRWWNEIKPDGSNEWIFESLEGQRQIHPREAGVFWLGLILVPIVWLIMAIVKFFGGSWESMMLCIIALVLDGSQIYGYIRCARDAKKRVNAFATQLFVEKATNFVVNNSSSNLSGGP